MTYARLLLPELLGELDWVLYVDADTRWRGDVYALWQERLGGAEEVLAIATPDCAASARKDGGEVGAYFCAGVMLTHLAAWRKEGIAAKCGTYLAAHREAVFWDQSALNRVCAGRVRLVDKAWNRYVDEAGECRVLHYAGHNPWVWGWRRNRPKGYHLAWYLSYWRYRWLP